MSTVQLDCIFLHFYALVQIDACHEVMAINSLQGQQTIHLEDLLWLEIRKVMILKIYMSAVQLDYILLHFYAHIHFYK